MGGRAGNLIYRLLQHASRAVYRIRKLHFRLRWWRSPDSSVSPCFNAERDIFVSFVRWSVWNSIAPRQSWANAFWNERRGCKPARSQQQHVVLWVYAKVKAAAACVMLCGLEQDDPGSSPALHKPSPVIIWLRDRAANAQGPGGRGVWWEQCGERRMVSVTPTDEGSWLRRCSQLSAFSPACSSLPVPHAENFPLKRAFF